MFLTQWCTRRTMNHSSSRVLQMDAAHSKNSLMANMYFHEMMGRDSLKKDLGRQKKLVMLLKLNLIKM